MYGPHRGKVAVKAIVLIKQKKLFVNFVSVGLELLFKVLFGRFRTQYEQLLILNIQPIVLVSSGPIKQDKASLSLLKQNVKHVFITQKQ